MDNETLQAIRLMLKEELKEELEPIKNDIQGLKEGQGRLETKFSTI